MESGLPNVYEYQVLQAAILENIKKELTKCYNYCFCVGVLDRRNVETVKQKRCFILFSKCYKDNPVFGGWLGIGRGGGERIVYKIK